MGKNTSIIRFAQGLDRRTGQDGKGFPRLQSFHFGRRGKAVPRRCLLTAVASVDAVAQMFGGLRRDVATVFDGEIGQAEAGIQPVGCPERSGRAGGQAAGACAAAALHG